MINFFQSNLKYLRKKTGKTQTDIALQLGKAHTSIGNWEKGISEPSMSDMVGLCHYFDISMQNLVFDDLQNVADSPKPAFEKKSKNVVDNVANDVVDSGILEPNWNIGRDDAILSSRDEIQAMFEHNNPPDTYDKFPEDTEKNMLNTKVKSAREKAVYQVQQQQQSHDSIDITYRTAIQAQQGEIQALRGQIAVLTGVCNRVADLESKVIMLENHLKPS